jgi:hypothetical protein
VRAPRFIVLGAPKTGTTTLHFWLEQHPDVFVPAEKETHFFDHHLALGLGWYQDRFADAPPGAVVGEVATTYLDHHTAPVLVSSWFPGVRTMAILREPAERAWSHAWDFISKRGLRPDAATELRRQLAGNTPSRGFGDLLRPGRYGEHLGQWRRSLDPGQILVLLTDDMKADPACAYEQVCAHIGVDPSRAVPGKEHANKTRPPRSPRLLQLMLRARAGQRVPAVARWVHEHNRLPGTPAMPAELRRDLVAHYAADLDTLETILDRSLPATWRRVS